MFHLFILELYFRQCIFTILIYLAWYNYLWIQLSLSGIGLDVCVTYISHLQITIFIMICFQMFINTTAQSIQPGFCGLWLLLNCFHFLIQSKPFWHQKLLIKFYTQSTFDWIFCSQVIFIEFPNSYSYTSSIF